MTRSHRVLLIESDDYSVEIIEKFIEMHFPHLDVRSVKPSASLELLEKEPCDIVVCDAFLRHDERISFISQLCQNEDILLIIITGDTEITPDTFLSVGQSCIHHVLYKPLDLQALSEALRCAIERARARKTEIQ